MKKRLTKFLSVVLILVCVVSIVACSADPPMTIEEFCDKHQTDNREILDYFFDREGRYFAVQLILDYYGAEEFLEIAVEYCREIVLEAVIEEFGIDYINDYYYDYYR